MFIRFRGVSPLDAFAASSRHMKSAFAISRTGLPGALVAARKFITLIDPD